MSALKIVGGIFAIVVGLYVGYQTVMHPIHLADDTNKINLRGTINSILAIVLGISLVLNGLGII
jgi:hypothetical protein